MLFDCVSQQFCPKHRLVRDIVRRTARERFAASNALVSPFSHAKVRRNTPTGRHAIFQRFCHYQPASQPASFRPHGERKHQLKALIIHHNFPECGTTTTITVPFIISGTCQCGCCSTPTAIDGAECITLPRHSHTQTRRKTPVCVFPFFLFSNFFFFFLALLILFRGFVHQKGMKNTCPPID